ncbi:hypothetical protein [Methylobacterium durans]|uniref:Uncharacterized protein n=1 Tax=Methylobacterium durans TaxID=2202825 RepID=A0A2U8WD61_9HYPH|nr:hypothetical protein [Methylobacterium durans]AWN43380.1 hypothetical protein DK389_26300 [Methylobacterium durans]
MFVKDADTGIYRCRKTGEDKGVMTCGQSPDRKLVFALNRANRHVSLARLSTEDEIPPVLSSGKCVW